MRWCDCYFMLYFWNPLGPRVIFYQIYNVHRLFSTICFIAWNENIMHLRYANCTGAQQKYIIMSFANTYRRTINITIILCCMLHSSAPIRRKLKHILTCNWIDCFGPTCAWLLSPANCLSKRRSAIVHVRCIALSAVVVTIQLTNTNLHKSIRNYLFSGPVFFFAHSYFIPFIENQIDRIAFVTTYE